jgi:hypothetical protein
MSYICEFCNKEFSSNSNLKIHKKTAKYCLNLQIRNDSDIEKKEIPTFECEFCNKQFNLKHVLLTHYKSCKEKIIEKDNEFIKLKDNEIKLLKEELNKIKEDFFNYKLKVEKDNLKAEKEKLILEIENKHLNSLLVEEKNRLKEEKQEKDRLNELVSKSKNINTTNIQTNINTKYKDNFDELFEKLPKFTQENLINSFKDVLNEDIFLQGIDCFSKVINRNLGIYGIVSDFSRNKIVIKDKDGNLVNTISPKVFIDSINNIEEITKEVLAKSREKVDTFDIMEQDVYINNLYPIKELILNCENEQTSDKNIMKYGKKLTDNCQVVTRTNLPSDNLIEMTSL